MHELPGSMGQQRVLEHKFCHFKNKHGMLLPDDALLLFKDKQFAENVVGHDNDDLAEQLDAHGPQLAVGRGKRDMRSQQLTPSQMMT